MTDLIKNADDGIIMFPVLLSFHKEQMRYMFPSLSENMNGALFEEKTNLQKEALNAIRKHLRRSLALEVPLDVKRYDLCYPWSSAENATMSYVSIEKADLFEKHEVQTDGFYVPYMVYRDVANLATKTKLSFNKVLNLLVSEMMRISENGETIDAIKEILKNHKENESE